MNDVEPDAEATQQFAWLVLGPQFVGWMLQIFVSGISFHSATLLLLKTTLISRRMRVVLIITLVLLGMCLCTTVADLLLWGTTQQRSRDDMWQFNVVDACIAKSCGIRIRVNED